MFRGDKKKKSKKKSTGSKDRRGKGTKNRKKKSKSHQNRSKEKRYYYHQPKQQMEDIEQRKDRKRNSPQLTPSIDENLNGIVLVKDAMNKGGIANAHQSKEKPWKPISFSPAHRSLENFNQGGMISTNQQPANRGVKKVSVEKFPLLPDVLGPINPNIPALPMNSMEKIQKLSIPSLKRKGKENADDELMTRGDDSDEEKNLSLTREEKLCKWKSYLERTLDAGVYGIQKEFSQMKGYLPTAATRVFYDNHPFDNRFEDIVCIDHTRVVVKQNVYIHANWVEIDKNRKMILTQLPLQHTASIFWQMVLETNSQGILLFLTHHEYDTFNASAIFPKQQDFLHFKDRHIRVGEFKRVKVAPNWMMHVLSITNGEKKRFLHLHVYSGWYHGHELKNFTDLLKIQSAFKKYKDPHVVMSLSGCGRAGTYAAFEAAHSRLHSDKSSQMSVIDTVMRVRDGRLHAVQRAAQLKTIHLALLEHVISNGFNKDLTTQYKNNWEKLQKSEDE